MESVTYILLYFLLLLSCFIFSILNIHKYKTKTSIYIFLIWILSAISAYFFYEATNGVVRDYSKITLIPFIYLFVALNISIYPIYKYDHIQYFGYSYSSKQHKILVNVALFSFFCSILPLIENILRLPVSFGNSDVLSDMYEDRENYLSFFGRKFQLLCDYLSLVSPIVLFYLLSLKKKSWKLIGGCLCVVLNECLFSFNTGGRSGLVQNLFYLFIVYAIMEKNIDQKIKKRINYIGLFLISFLIIAVLLVTISRYNSSESDTGNIFTWFALYAGEGPLNFNNDMWYVTKSTNGDNTFVALRWLLGLTDVDSVQDNWLINQNLGVRGNVFYTYIGFIFADYNIVGTILFLSLISILLLMKIKTYRNKLPIHNIFYIALWSRVLFSGTTFYSYMNFRSNFVLLYTLLFCIYLEFNYANKPLQNS